MYRFHVKQKLEINDLELIEEVKKHESLYDIKHPDYRNLPRRAEIWSEVSESLGIRDFNIVTKRWKVIREKFAIAYKKFVGDKIVPSWNLYESCRFLKPHINLNVERKKQIVTDSEDEIQTNQIIHSPFDEHKLVKLIEQRPCIYDRNCADFKSVMVRKIAWKEISIETGWNTQQIQKRWRVLRDRFVRELRRTKNFTDPPVVINSLFCDMLFLTRHVKSRNYEIETDINDEAEIKEESLILSEVSDNNITIEATTEDQEIIEETTENESGHISQSFEESYCYTEQYDEEVNAEEIDDDHDTEFVREEQYEEEAINQSTAIDQEEEIAHYEEVPTQVLISRKRKHHNIEMSEATSRINVTSAPPDLNLTMSDEDLAFGQTIGLMLKKIPNHLKTAVKLKIFQSLDEFEIAHKLK